MKLPNGPRNERSATGTEQRWFWVVPVQIQSSEEELLNNFMSEFAWYISCFFISAAPLTGYFIFYCLPPYLSNLAIRPWVQFLALAAAVGFGLYNIVRVTSLCPNSDRCSEQIEQ
jgi:hypothetical protein